ncbi:MAG: ABC transporter substrate-binding protein [Stackebrandtia sp.]
MSKKWLLSGAALLALALVTAGCGSGGSQADAKTRVFKADNGKVTIPDKPERVVATGYAVPALIEADAPLVGISKWKRGIPLMSKDEKSSYDKLEKVAGELASETNYEAIAEVKPDLIVIGVPKPVLGDVDVERLESIAPVVAIGPTVPSAWRELSKRQADAAGALKGFNKVKDEYEDKSAELSEKYADVLPQRKLGHVGSYGEVDKGNFQREFNDSWGTNIVNDVGAEYYGEVKEKGGGSKDVSEYASIEELPEAFADADTITYSLGPDGKPMKSVQYVLDSKLWKNLPAVKAGKAYGIRYTEAATYASAVKTLEAVDQALAPLRDQ